MRTFLVKTAIPGYTGESAGIVFDKGQAMVTVDAVTGQGLSAMRYFVEAGYPISEPDGEPVDQVALFDALGLPSPAPQAAIAAARAAEVESLTKRRDALKAAADLDKLRAEVAELEEAAAEKAEAERQADAEAAAEADANGPAPDGDNIDPNAPADPPADPGKTEPVDGKLPPARKGAAK